MPWGDRKERDVADIAEEVRILRASLNGLLTTAPSGRWRIEGETAPQPKARQRLQARQWIRHDWQNGRMAITDEGLAAFSVMTTSGRRHLVINRCGTCGIVLPSLLPSGARIVSSALCAHKDDREYVYAETGAWPVPAMTGKEQTP